MPTFIKHRVNEIKAISKLEREWGAEIDLRSDPNTGEIHLSHDPFVKGDSFDDWLREFKTRGCQGPIVLNVKEDGLEENVTQKMLASQFYNFFFLDCSLPTLVRLSRAGERHFAIRVSSYERVTLDSPLIHRIDWAWIDCFQAIPLDVAALRPLRDRLKICVVSPELQNGKLGPSVGELSQGFLELAQQANAICTKDPHAWIRALEASEARPKRRRA